MLNILILFLRLIIKILQNKMKKIHSLLERIVFLEKKIDNLQINYTKIITSDFKTNTYNLEPIKEDNEDEDKDQDKDKDKDQDQDQDQDKEFEIVEDTNTIINYPQKNNWFYYLIW